MGVPTFGTFSEAAPRGSSRRGVCPTLGVALVVVCAVGMFISVTCIIKGTDAMPTGWRTFGLHPVLMTLAFGFLAPVAAVSYRGLEAVLGVSHSTAKLCHGLLTMAAVLVAALGFADMYLVHEDKKKPHFASVHSWLGLAVLIALALQWTSGLAVFCTSSLDRLVAKATWRPTHVVVGAFVLFGGVGSICLGLLSLTAASTNPAEVLQAKYAALLALLLGLLAGFVVASPDMRTGGSEGTPLVNEPGAAPAADRSYSPP